MKLGGLNIRHDRNCIAIFNPDNGAKVRLAIGKYTKASRPELVDIKITDYCFFGCDFCYQGSTEQGKHAELSDIQHVISELQKAKVFEVALGGGEPTTHPDFIQILEEFRAANIVPNFTTRNLGWIKRNWDNIANTAGAFAYSTETVSGLNKAQIMFGDVPKDRINIHYIMGLGSAEDFIKFMSHCHELDFRVTLLGYKTVGRGDEVEHVSYDWWIDAVKFLQVIGKCPTLSIDTPMAAEFDGVMPVEKKFYHTREGAFSLYIDAVSMKMGASSFENLDDLVPFDGNWRKTYRSI